MKKDLLSLTIFFLLTFHATFFSQSAKNTIGPVFTPNTYRFGIKAPNGFAHKYKVTDNFLAAGLEFTFHFAKRSAFTAQLLLTHLKYKVEYAYFSSQLGDPAIAVKSEVEVNYQEVPLQYSFYLFPWAGGRKMNLALNAGVNSVWGNHLTEKTTFEDNSIRNTGYLNSFLFGAEVGLVAEIHFSTGTTLKFGGEYGTMFKGIDKIMDQKPIRIRGIICLASKIEWKCFFKKGAWKPFPSCD